MKQIKLVTAVVLSFYISSISQAEEALFDLGNLKRDPANIDPANIMVTPPLVHTTTVTAPPPELSDKTKNKYYEVSDRGLEEYLKDIENENPQARAALQGDLDNIKSKTFVSKTILWTGVISGVSFATIGAVGAFSSSTIGQQADKITPIMIIGIGLLGAGCLGAALTQPSASDYRKFVNKNNELVPDHQLKLKNVGFNFEPETKTGALALNFSF